MPTWSSAALPRTMWISYTMCLVDFYYTANQLPLGHVWSNALNDALILLFTLIMHNATEY